MKVMIFEEDVSLLRMLRFFLQNQGHQVQGFTQGYKCPLYLLEECGCPSDNACAGAVIINTRIPDQDSIRILIDQQQKGCKLPKRNKAIMSANFTLEQEEYIRDQGFSVIRKPFRLRGVLDWLNDCSLTLRHRSS